MLYMCMCIYVYVYIRVNIYVYVDIYSDGGFYLLSFRLRVKFFVCLIYFCKVLLFLFES